MRRTEALKIIARVLKQPVDDVPAADLIYGRALAHIETPGPDAPRPWAMQVDVLALKIAAQLPLAEDTEQSPLARAEDAKRRRDLGGELAALQQGHTDLTSAPWYPERPGDLVHVHYEQVGDFPAFGETYHVTAGAHGFLSMQLLCHTLPEADDAGGMVGCFAVDDDPDPLMDLWMEAGPHRLTIVRDGRVVHGMERAKAPAPAPTPEAAALAELQEWQQQVILNALDERPRSAREKALLLRTLAAQIEAQAAAEDEPDIATWGVAR